ncbi:MAG: phosphotransferase, partial [bacterium]
GHARADQGLFVDMPWDHMGSWFRHLEVRDASTGTRLLHLWERNGEVLTQLVPGAPEPIVIHGDVTPWNLRYRTGALSGLLDFDLAHLDLRVADFALSWRGRHDGVLEGYQEVSRLEPVEEELVIPIYLAWILACAACSIRDGGSLEWELAHLRRQRLRDRVATA